MLLRFDPCRTRDALTEVQEAANFIAEVSKGLVVNRSWGARSHRRSISYYDINGNAAEHNMAHVVGDQAQTNSEAGKRGGRDVGFEPAPRPPRGKIYGSAYTYTVSEATMATYCLPFLLSNVMGLEFASFSSLVTHSSLPVLESKARKRWSIVAPMKTSPPAVVIGPALPPFPVFCFPSGSPSVRPSVVVQATSPVFPLTAIRRPHGGFWHGQLPTTLPVASLPGALKPE